MVPPMKNVWRALIEVGFIIFLFCSNLLMGEFERSGVGVKKGVVWVIEDVFTIANFEIGATAGLIGYVVFEFLGRDSRQAVSDLWRQKKQLCTGNRTLQTPALLTGHVRNA
jgi:hypothetical protein